MTSIRAAWDHRATRRALLAALLVGPFFTARAGQNDRKAKDMQNTTLWQLIEAVGGYPSLDPTALAAVLPVTFTPTTRNAHFAMHEATGVLLADGAEITHVELRTSLQSAERGLVVLNVSGACIDKDLMRQHYPDVALSNVPRGRSMNEQTGFATQQPWGKLSFGFKESNRDCLARVVIDRTAAKAE